MNRFVYITMVMGICLQSIGGFADTIAPNAVSITVGAKGGRLSSVAKAGEGATLRLYPDTSGSLSATFSFNIETQGSGSTLSAVYRSRGGPESITVEALDSDGTAVMIGTWNAARSFKSSSINLSEITVGNTAQIRLSAGPNAHDIVLDALSISVTTAPGAGGGSEPRPGPAPTPAPMPAPNMLIPPTGKILWDWQIGASSASAVVPPPGARLIDIDGFEASATTVSALKSKGLYTVCYIDVGSYENGRPDSSQFPEYLKIYYDSAWGEWFLDVTDVFKANSVLATILRNRIKMCKEKGFDALEPDNLQNDENAGGKITKQQQLDFNSWIADVAHEYGLAVFQKNGPDKILQKDSWGHMMVDKFDAILNEQCQEYNECAPLAEYPKRGKLALNVEYKKGITLNCTQSNSLQINSIKKDLNLVGGKDGGYLLESCP